MKIVPQKLTEINFQPLKREIWFWMGLGLLIFAIGKLLDASSFGWIDEYLRTQELNVFSIFLTERLIWGILIFFAIVTGWRAWINPDHHTKLIPALFAVFVTGVLAFTFKSVFSVVRPSMVMEIVPLIHAPSLSFPSAHTAVAFALLIPFFRISKTIGVMWLVFALLIGFARVYQNVHFPSDIAGGIFLGGVVGSFFSNPEIRKLLETFWKELEFRRQSFHFIAGFLCVFAHWAGFLRLRFIFFSLLLGLIISFIAQHRKLPLLESLLHLFDRPRDKSFPGRGAFCFLLGVFITFFLFREENIRIAYASILILSVGDSLNHMFDTRVPGHLRLPWNKRKHVPGLVIGILAGVISAQFFVPIAPAILATTIALLMESVPFKLGKIYIDDNILVPVVAGGILWMFV